MLSTGIRAQVRVKATMHGREQWQMREISSGDGTVNTGSLEAHFGLGDATNVDLIRIEWPSGIVQELTNLAPKQLLTITEQQAGVTQAPGLTAAPYGTVQLALTGLTDLLYVVEASTNLVQWTKIAVRTNLTGTVDYTPEASSALAKFYRVQVP